MKISHYICNHKRNLKFANVMDIVSRLKQFIDSHSIPVTAFADTCGIPRPSLSQLLNGRNKKVSDEVIAKIHAAYPSLSMLWLMFGEGVMESDANIQTSEPQTTLSEPISQAEVFETEDDDSPMDFNVTYIADSPENMAKRSAAEYARFARAEEARRRENDAQTVSPSVTTQDRKTKSTISFDAAKGKRVVSIVVYYDDQSYQSFIPDPSGRSPFS